MQVTETSAEGLKREFKIVIPAGDLEERISRRLGEIGQAVRIPGFRPGKVPMQLLRRRFGTAVRGEVLESTLQGSTADAVREQNLRPALPPKVEILSADEGADLEYKMSVELLPDMPQPDFADLGIERLVVDVPEEDIDRALERMAEQQRKSEPVERPAQTGDIVVVDLVGRIGDEEIAGSRGENREIEIGGAGFLPGLTEQLVGTGAGEQRIAEATFPEDFGNPDIAGKQAVFDIAVKEVKQRLPAVVDDALAKEVGLETLAELRQEIRQRMQRDYDAVSRQRLKRTLLDKLSERYQFPVPPGMVELEFDNIWEQYEAEKERQQEAAASAAPEAPEPGGEAPIDAAAVVAPEETALEGATDRSPSAAAAEHEQQQRAAAERTPSVAAAPDAAAEGPIDAAAIVAPEETALEGASDTSPAAANQDDERARSEYRAIAERRVRLGLLLAEVGRTNNITVTQEELNQALVREAQRHAGYERQVLDYYRNNPEAANNLRAPIYEEKVVDFILELAKLEERKVTPQELWSLAGAEPGEESEAGAQ